MVIDCYCSEDDSDGEAGRRAELRAFLIQRRSELTPDDVGLPQTAGHRRVVGLRREEVAELAGVSNDWYRWLESGRMIRASAPFLARLADALLLNSAQRSTLYQLALPDLYKAHAAQQTRNAREVMLIGNTSRAPSKERLRAARSWERRLLRCGRYAYTGS
jgi:transcriptional regulator with XRE-family HTH domain